MTSIVKEEELQYSSTAVPLLVLPSNNTYIQVPQGTAWYQQYYYLRPPAPLLYLRAVVTSRCARLSQLLTRVRRSLLINSNGCRLFSTPIRAAQGGRRQGCWLVVSALLYCLYQGTLRLFLLMKSVLCKKKRMVRNTVVGGEYQAFILQDNK